MGSRAMRKPVIMLAVIQARVGNAGSVKGMDKKPMQCHTNMSTKRQ